jgi:glycosyltransferase involved in cell wall biosynthesis
VRVCLAYDCLYPWTVGGGERWLRALAEDLASKGHQVTYLTRCQWDEAAPPEIEGVKVVVVSPKEKLYGDDGTRTIGQALRYGKGVFAHLLRHRGNYDVVHITASPYFGVFGAWAALRGAPPVLFVDWHEAWTRDYWRQYLGRWRGELGWLMQRICVRLCQHSFINSELHAERLRGQGIRGELTTLPGLYSGPAQGEAMPAQQPPLVVFAGRQIPEKRVLAIPAAIVEARRQQPDLQALILGDGPDHAALLAEIARCEAGSFIDAPGFVTSEEVAAAIGRATCLLLPSSREGYGIVIVEAAAKGTPSIVVAGDDNAAVELVSEGENGFVAADASPDALARAITAAVEGGRALRNSTHDWFSREAERLSVAESARIVEQSHRAALSN